MKWKHVEVLVPAAWLRNYRAQPSAIFTDLLVGLLASLSFWPLALGHAVLAGVPAQVGMCTTFTPSVLYALFGSLPQVALQSGSTAALFLGEITRESTALGLRPTEIAVLTCGLVALVHLVLGIFDLGGVAALFSKPLLSGRLGAAALMVTISQSKVIFGVALPPGSRVPLQSLFATISVLPAAHGPTCGLSASLIVFLFFCRLARCTHSADGSFFDDASLVGAGRCRICASRCVHYSRTILCALAKAMGATGNVLVLVLGAAACFVLPEASFNELDPIEAPRPAWQLTVVGASELYFLAGPSILLAVLLFGSHMIVVERVRRPGEQWSPRRELIAMAISGFGAAAVGGMPVMSSLGVSQALASGTSGFASLGNAGGHWLSYRFVASFRAFSVPSCAIAVVLLAEFLPLLRMIPGDLRRLFAQARSISGSWTFLLSSDLGIYVVALLSPLVLGIVYGSVAAVALELLMAMSRFAGPRFVYIGRVPATHVYDEIGVPGSRAEELYGINIVRVEGARWFGNAVATSKLARRERRAAGRTVLCVITDWRMVPFLDETAVAHYKQTWGEGIGARIIVTGASILVRRQMAEGGLLEILQQPEETLVDLHAAVVFAEQCVESIEAEQVAIGVRRSSASEFVGVVIGRSEFDDVICKRKSSNSALGVKVQPG